jgi:hypothetical protein
MAEEQGSADEREAERAQVREALQRTQLSHTPPPASFEQPVIWVSFGERYTASRL